MSHLIGLLGLVLFLPPLRSRSLSHNSCLVLSFERNGKSQLSALFFAYETEVLGQICVQVISLEKSRRDEVPSVFLNPAEKNGFPFVL